MPLYLIRETSSAAQCTIVTPVVVYEIEVEADSLRAAAEAVMGRPRGKLPKGMSFRAQTHEPYTYRLQYIEPDPKKYAGIADIVEGQRGTLPPEDWTLHVPLPENVEAARAVLEEHTRAMRIDDEGKPAIALYHLLHSLADFAHAEGFSFGETLEEVLADRWSVTGIAGPRIAETSVGTDADEVLDRMVAAGRDAIRVHAERFRLEDCEDPSVGLYHLLHSLIDLCAAERIDFPGLFGQVRADRPEAALPVEMAAS